MDITKQIKKILDKTEDGIIMTPADFGVSVNQQPSLIVALNRLVANGKLKRLSKGKYYKPIQSQYFGEIPPDTFELVKDFILKEGKRIGYITGTNAFSRLGLTTQISGTVLIGTNTYRRPLRRGIEKIAFVLQPNPICEEDMDLYVILDALRFIQRIPATTPSEAVEMLLPIIKRLPKQRKNHLQDLALAYTPSVRALLGAMCEQLSIPCKRLKNSLNGTTYYRLHIDDDILSTKSNWRIIWDFTKINYMLDALEDKELNFRFNEQGIRNRSFNKTLNPDFDSIELDEFGDYKTIGIFKCVL